MTTAELERRIEGIEATIKSLLSEISSMNETVFQMAMNHLALFEVLEDKGIVDKEEMDAQLESQLARLLATYGSGTFSGTEN